MNTILFYDIYLFLNEVLPSLDIFYIHQCPGERVVANVLYLNQLGGYVLREYKMEQVLVSLKKILPMTYITFLGNLYAILCGIKM